MCISEEHARLREIRAELADLQEQATEFCQEGQRLIDEKRELLQALESTLPRVPSREYAPEIGARS